MRNKKTNKGGFIHMIKDVFTFQFWGEKRQSVIDFPVLSAQRILYETRKCIVAMATCANIARASTPAALCRRCAARPNYTYDT